MRREQKYPFFPTLLLSPNPFCKYFDTYAPMFRISLTAIHSLDNFITRDLSREPLLYALILGEIGLFCFYCAMRIAHPKPSS